MGTINMAIEVFRVVSFVILNLDKAVAFHKVLDRFNTSLGGVCGSKRRKCAFCPFRIESRLSEKKGKDIEGPFN